MKIRNVKVDGIVYWCKEDILEFLRNQGLEIVFPKFAKQEIDGK